LRKYERGHPGFLVLDSPLVTYRAPDASQAIREVINNEDFMSGAVADSFYRDVARVRDRQVIVIENTDPPDGLGIGTALIKFTKSHDTGRYGFFPV
jgi:hypothetical protein